MLRNQIHSMNVFLALCFFALLSGCSSVGSNSQGTGSIAAKLDWGNAAKVTAKTVYSAPSGVATVRIIITGSGIATSIQKDFVAAAGSGTIDGVPVGTGLTLTAQGLDASGTVAYQGTSSNITVQAGQTADAGTVIMVSITGSSSAISEVQLPGGEFDMGDHYGYVDPSHPSDELPIHKVKVNAFYMATTTATNKQFLDFLNDSLSKGLIEVRNKIVYATGGSDVYYYTNQYASYYSIGFDGKTFTITDFRANHPVVGVMWFGAAAYCNWLSLQNGLQECYNLKTWVCDFTKNGYRLPTEAEWEYAARGGQYNPYYNYPWGNERDNTRANWPNSKNPYQGTDASTYPWTTPVGFYDGKLKLKSEFNWPGSVTSYQTTSGANAFGLYDMAGNVWQFVNDWYGQNYYSSSSYDNPKGPDTGFIMPDGKAYRGMRGGNWYNGDVLNGVDDGHSRVSNRNPSYYRGPQDPNHPWYHVGFRVARNYTAKGSFSLTSDAGVNGGTLPAEYTCDGSGVSPALSWSNAPEGTQAFALLMTTLPGDGTTKWNWVLYNIPATATSINKNSSGGGTLGVGSDGPSLAYQPPCSQGPGAKLYTFTLYALSASPTISMAAKQVTGAVLTSAIQTITLGSVTLNLSYTRT